MGGPPPMCAHTHLAPFTCRIRIWPCLHYCSSEGGGSCPHPYCALKDRQTGRGRLWGSLPVHPPRQLGGHQGRRSRPWSPPNTQRPPVTTAPPGMGSFRGCWAAGTKPTTPRQGERNNNTSPSSLPWPPTCSPHQRGSHLPQVVLQHYHTHFTDGQTEAQRLTRSRTARERQSRARDPSNPGSQALALPAGEGAGGGARGGRGAGHPISFPI